MKWSKEWPKEEGFYWIYGVIYEGETKKELCFVEAFNVQNGLIYVRDGNFYYKSEAGDVVWKKIETPELPK